MPAFLCDLCALGGEPLFADATFPRGPGFYFNIFKLLAVVAVYLVWIKTCGWVGRDAVEWKMPNWWNLIMFGCGAVGLAIVWLVPWFLLSFPLLLLCYAGPSLAYISLRNQKAPEDKRVLTEDHLLGLFRRKKEVPAPRLVPVRFIGKSLRQVDEDAGRVERARDHKGYRTAQELVGDAWQARATDIHLLPTKSEMTVRLRVDGVLQTAAPYSRSIGDSLINVFKELAALDVAIKQQPQEGSFSAQVEDRVVGVRVATAASAAGEKVVLQLLDRARVVSDLARLGMRDRLHAAFSELVTGSHGLILVCGPAGSGKRTTLYACLGAIDRYTKNVITVENPVEYKIANVTQIEVNPRTGKTFAGELSNVLRQKSPDVIYLGEIRDPETAEMACRAAVAGNLVLTTLHANDAITSVARLLDLGVEAALAASALAAVLGQRLVRLLCPKCKIRYVPDPELLRKANLPADRIKFLYKPRVAPPDDPDDEAAGKPRRERCRQCGGSGYYGRIGVFELLAVNDKMRELIRADLNFNALRQEALKNGLKYLQDDALRLVLEGETSIQEVLRVC